MKTLRKVPKIRRGKSLHVSLLINIFFPNLPKPKLHMFFLSVALDVSIKNLKLRFPGGKDFILSISNCSVTYSEINLV